MNHLEVWKNENIRSQKDYDWFRWCETVRDEVRFNLDGDQEENGYSLDELYDWFESGIGPFDAAAKLLDQVKSPRPFPPYTEEEAERFERSFFERIEGNLVEDNLS